MDETNKNGWQCQPFYTISTQESVTIVTLYLNDAMPVA